MYGRILRQLRVAKGRTQSAVAKSIGISPAHLARLEASQRGLYIEDFVRIAEALGEKPGNLLPNDVGEFGHLKTIIDQLALVPRQQVPLVASIVTGIAQLIRDSGATAPPGEVQPGRPLQVRSRKARR